MTLLVFNPLFINGLFCFNLKSPDDEFSNFGSRDKLPEPVGFE